MIKITVEQAVSAVKSAATAEELQAVFEQCKKDQIHEVFLAVTGSERDVYAKSWKKADLVRHHTARTVAFKARETFKVMDAEAKAEYLTSQRYKQGNNTVNALTEELSLYDLIALTMSLGVSFEEYKGLTLRSYGVERDLNTCINHAVRGVRCLVANKKQAEVSTETSSSVSVHTEVKSESNTVKYTDVKAAYENYCEAENKYLASDKTDVAEKKKADTAYVKYLSLLAEYRKGAMPERAVSLNWIREYCEEAMKYGLSPIDSLEDVSFPSLIALCLKCGINPVQFMEMETFDIAARLLHEAGVKGFEEIYDYDSELKEVREISSYIVGKQIVELKGNAKAQQELLKICGDNFLLAMFTVFYAPMRVSMETPEELRKYMCRNVLKAVRTLSYAKILLENLRANLKKNTTVNRS